MCKPRNKHNQAIKAHIQCSTKPPHSSDFTTASTAILTLHFLQVFIRCGFVILYNFTALFCMLVIISSLVYMLIIYYLY